MGQKVTCLIRQESPDFIPILERFIGCHPSREKGQALVLWGCTVDPDWDVFLQTSAYLSAFGLSGLVSLVLAYLDKPILQTQVWLSCIDTVSSSMRFIQARLFPFCGFEFCVLC